MSMRKLAIALSMFALAGSVTFGKAPLIGGIPDIVIGDEEDKTGPSLTIDMNWFRTVDAFDIRNYTSDVDSPQSDWMFAFFEQTTANDIGVRIDQQGATARTVTQILAADRERPANWGANEITNYGQATRDWMLTFVDLVRSPEPYGNNGAAYPDPLMADGSPAGVDDNLPWHNTQGSTALSGDRRVIWLYAASDEAAGATAADPTSVTCDAMNIISRNYAFDVAQGGVSSVTGCNFNFASGAGTTSTPAMWTYSTYTGFAACTSGAAAGAGGLNGYLSLSANVAATTGFARWSTVANTNGANVGAIPFVQGPSLIYCARFTMSQQNPNGLSGFAPQIRLGVNESHFLTNVISTIKPMEFNGRLNNPQVPDAGMLQTYKVVWSANETAPDFAAMNHANGDLRTYNAFFDVLDQYNLQGGTWTLHNVDVVTAPRPADVTPALSYTDFRATAGWTLEGSAGTSITSSFGPTGAMTFTDTGSPDNAPVFAYYLWKRAMDKAAVRWTDNQLLRFKVALSCPTPTARANFHWFRLRQSTAAFNIGNEWSLLGDDGGDALWYFPATYYPLVPPATPTTPHVYETYMASQVDAVHDWDGDDAVPNDGISDLNRDVINLAMDAISNQKRPSTGWPPTTHQNATSFTVHSVAVEVLADNL